MKMFNKVVIIGTGLIGGSIGAALKNKRLAAKVIGLSRHLKNAALAKKMGAIDSVGKSLAAVKEADLVILATPVDTIIDFALKIHKLIKKECIVIDVGSTKELIVSKLSSIIPNFLGCHPLAGSEKKGILNLETDIFKGSICIITPNRLVNSHTLNKVSLLWRKLGARVVKLAPADHDRILGFTSHLPHLAAFALIDSVPKEYLTFSSSGLKDTTRISASDANLWVEIFLSNRENSLHALSVFQNKLSALKLTIEKRNKKQLIKLLQSARRKREALG
jgi:prephenate dehydrogenase